MLFAFIHIVGGALIAIQTRYLRRIITNVCEENRLLTKKNKATYPAAPLGEKVDIWLVSNAASSH